MSAFGPDDPAAKIWSSINTPGIVDSILALTTEPALEPAPWLPVTEDLAIEVWTECELAVIHAVADLLLRSGREGRAAERLLARLDHAVAWHLEHTQPDNATGRPWAVHAFLLRGDPQADAVDYAASMLHTVEASRASDAPLEPLVDWILADAARGLAGDTAIHLSRWLR